MAVNARNGLLKLTSRWNNEAVLNPKEILILNLMPTKEQWNGSFCSVCTRLALTAR